jgi:enamine deaminase RidA (YjgF/YER057c/UK114 family)
MKPADRIRVRSRSPYEPAVGFSRAVRVADRVIVSGTAPVLPVEIEAEAMLR